jgi:hypothetical protein
VPDRNDNGLWRPTVVGREKLGPRHWAVLVEAPFDMPAHAPCLVGRRVCLDGHEFEVRGSVTRMPTSHIAAGELMELLVAPVGFEE